MRHACIAATLMLLAGCVTQPVATSLVFSDTSTLHHWSAQGRMGVAGVTQSGSGSFTWQQRNDTSQVDLHGPLGVGAVSVTMNDALHVTLGNGAHYDADDALRELEMRLGVAVPVKPLSYWLRGIPAPGEFVWNNNGTKVLQQDGWRIEYGDSMMVDKFTLPRKITATRDQVRIRVVIEEWQLR